MNKSELSADIAAFLAKGGEVKKCTTGERAMSSREIWQRTRAPDAAAIPSRSERKARAYDAWRAAHPDSTAVEREHALIDIHFQIYGE